MKRIFTAAAVLALATGVAVAAPTAPKKAAAKQTCPVMKEHTLTKVTADTAHSVYKGKTYYFCCAGCKPEFDKNPAKYVKADAKPMKPSKIKKS